MNPSSIKDDFARLVSYARTPQPPPVEPRHRFAYGMAQPLLGARLLLRDRPLLKQALEPALLLAMVCALTAFFGIGPGKSFLARFYQTFALLAPLPSVVFAKHYGRMSAAVRNKLGFGPVEPRREPLHTVLFRAGAQAVVVAIGLIPVIALLKLVPALGEPLAKVLAGLWALQWVVIDAFDDARVLKPGETLRMLDRQAELTQRPWFVRFFRSLGDGLPGVVGGPFNWFAGFLDKLSKSFREECALVEQNPALAAGFALTTAVLLATPVLNLAFRPIILVASAHLLGHLEKTEPSGLERAPLSQAQPPVLKLPLA